MHYITNNEHCEQGAITETVQTATLLTTVANPCFLFFPRTVYEGMFKVRRKGGSDPRAWLPTLSIYMSVTVELL